MIAACSNAAHFRLPLFRSLRSLLRPQCYSFPAGLTEPSGTGLLPCSGGRPRCARRCQKRCRDPRGADDRQPQGDGHTALEAVHLDGDVALVVVHGHHHVKLAPQGPPEDGIGREVTSSQARLPGSRTSTVPGCKRASGGTLCQARGLPTSWLAWVRMSTAPMTADGTGGAVSPGPRRGPRSRDQRRQRHPW